MQYQYMFSFEQADARRPRSGPRALILLQVLPLVLLFALRNAHDITFYVILGPGLLESENFSYSPSFASERPISYNII